MYKLITNVHSLNRVEFNYAVMDVKTGECYGFSILDESFESRIKHYIDRLTKGIGWIPTNYTASSTEFSASSDLKQVLPELFI